MALLWCKRDTFLEIANLCLRPPVGNYGISASVGISDGFACEMMAMGLRLPVGIGDIAEMVSGRNK